MLGIGAPLTIRTAELPVGKDGRAPWSCPVGGLWSAGCDHSCVGSESERCLHWPRRSRSGATLAFPVTVVFHRRGAPLSEPAVAGSAAVESGGWGPHAPTRGSGTRGRVGRPRCAVVTRALGCGVSFPRKVTVCWLIPLFVRYTRYLGSGDGHSHVHAGVQCRRAPTSVHR